MAADSWTQAGVRQTWRGSETRAMSVRDSGRKKPMIATHRRLRSGRSRRVGRSRVSLGRRRPDDARVRPGWGLGDVRRLMVVLGPFGGEQSDERRGENQELER